MRFGWPRACRVVLAIPRSLLVLEEFALLSNLRTFWVRMGRTAPQDERRRRDRRPGEIIRLG
jgi:hypothetical protein